MKIKLKNVRLKYEDLFEAVKFNGEENSNPRYSATFLIPKGSALDKELSKAISDLAVEKMGKKAEAAIKAWSASNQKCCYTDGDMRDSSDESFEGHMVLGCHRGEASGAPMVVDRNPEVRLTSKDGRPYPGCYVNATVDLWIQTKTYQGIRATLIAVQFAQDGEAFTTAPARVADGDFDDLSEGTDEEDDFFQDA